MISLKEISEAHDTIKGLATNIFLIPFWYVAIFLFNKEFYISADSIIIFAMCIVLSFISSFLLVFMMLQINKRREYSLFDDLIPSVVVSITWLSILIFIIYTLGFIFNIYIYFYWFLVIYFSPIFFFIVLFYLFKGME